MNTYKTVLLQFFACTGLIACNPGKKDSGWMVYKGSPASIHYSGLTEIDTSNVQRLAVAWTYHTGDADTIHHSQIQCNPIIIDGKLFGTSPQMKLFCVDASTGKEHWNFNPFDSANKDPQIFFILNNCRGVAYWSGDENHQRIYYTAGSFLYSIDAQNGKPDTSFGRNGRIDLHDGLDREVQDLFVTATSPPMVYKDLLIIGSRVDEGPRAAPGHIRAYDVRTGKRKWIFHTIPHPGEAGYESWDDPNAYQYIGGANDWSGFSLDDKRGILFASTGSASFDFYGGKRKGNDLYADCLIALDASSGKHLWHFQEIHHDVWDRDLSSPPALVSIQKNGRSIDAAALTTKSGFIFLFERGSGKPIYPIEERPVPQNTDLKDEKLSPTQPYPTAPAAFMRQSFTEKDINPLLSDTEQAQIKKRLASYKSDHLFNPPSLQGTVVFPGLDGGGEWGGPSFDPETGILYVNANEMPWVITAVNIDSKKMQNENYEQAGKRLYQNNCMSCHGPERKGSGNYPSLLGVSKKYSSSQFHSLLQSGRRMMPAFRQLNDNEREAIESFVLEDRNASKKKFVNDQRDDVFKLPYTITGYNKFLTAKNQPAIAPPWGTLNALDLSTGKYLWKIPLGNDTSFKNAGSPTGTENYGASVITKGGLVFIAATKDGKIRAFNKRSGKQLWEAELPAPGFATPAVYESGGRQFLVIACGGGKLGTRSGDSYVAFALPQK
ncbi:MAG: pyrroloquinoline quinone-dependent dehydrogenase [Flavisolibacter sp.]